MKRGTLSSGVDKGNISQLDALRKQRALVRQNFRRAFFRELNGIGRRGKIQFFGQLIQGKPIRRHKMEVVVKSLKVWQETVSRHGHDTQGGKHLFEMAGTKGGHGPNNSTRKRDGFNQIAWKAGDPGAGHTRGDIAAGDGVDRLDKMRTGIP